MERITSFAKKVYRKLCCCLESKGRKLEGSRSPTNVADSNNNVANDEAVYKVLQQLIATNSLQAGNNGAQGGLVNPEALSQSILSLTCEELAQEYVSAAYRELSQSDEAAAAAASSDKLMEAVKARHNDPKMIALRQIFSQKPSVEAKEKAFLLSQQIGKEVYDELHAPRIVEEVTENDNPS